LIFGVIYRGVIGLENVSRMCANSFFDHATWGHAGGCARSGEQPLVLDPSAERVRAAIQHWSSPMRAIAIAAFARS
jgi:hypothetical protein